MMRLGAFCLVPCSPIPSMIYLYVILYIIIVVKVLITFRTYFIY